MADDAGAFRLNDTDPGNRDRRGPLRPERLQSARLRLSTNGLVRLFQLGDAVGLAAASAAADALGAAEAARPFLLASPIVALLLLLAAGAYRRSAREPLVRRLGRVALAIVAAAGGVSAAMSLFDPSVAYGRAAGVWTLAAALTLVALHLVWSGAVRILRRRGLLTPNLIVVGATPAAAQLIRRALQEREANILGVFDDRKRRGGSALSGVPVLGGIGDLVGHRILPFVDRIVITVPPQADARITQLLERLAPIPNPIALLVDQEDATAEARALSRFADFDLMQVAGPRGRARYRLVKRTMDLAIGGLLLLALAPLMTLVALAIKLDSPGPTFFRQRRHGYLNEEIVVWKFRSMRAAAADATASQQVRANDDRVTRVGRFIRKTSLDELPQLFNVLSGEMSLVGPRPHAIGMLAGGADASKLVETYAHRHRIKPGLTGWAAVNGSRGPVDTPEAVRQRVALDLEYVERQSILLDLAILLKTAPCLIGDTESVR